VIDKLFFFSPNFFSSHAPQERDQENLATNEAATLPLSVTLLPNCVMMVGGSSDVMIDGGGFCFATRLNFFASSFPHQEECGQDY